MGVSFFVRLRKTTRVNFAAAAALASLLGLGGGARAATPPAVTPVNNQFFDWFVNTTPSYVPSPFLTNSNAGSVAAFLDSMPDGAVRAVKIENPINNATSNLIFNNPNFHVSYVLGDVEGVNATNEITALARQVRFVNGQNNGTKTQSFNAFVGNFGFTGSPNDKTFPAHYKQDHRGEHSFAGFGNGDFTSAKLNMSMPELYPGSPTERGVASGDSTAPNIRSGLFTMSILRVSQEKVDADNSTAIVPYIARFNNFGNFALDTDRNSANGFKFVPGQPLPARPGLPAMSAAQTTNQMLSRRDFATQVLHYRLRGADSFVAFEPGVDGYFNDQKRNDAKTGWNESHVAAIFGASDATLLLGKNTDYKNGKNDKDINGNIIEDGQDMSVEDAGALFSGVYSLSLGKLDVLLSNMDNDDHSLTLPSKIAGFDMKTKTFDLDGGSHLLVEYKLTTSGVNKGWSVALQTVPFTAIENSRNHFGIPEPGTVSLAAVAGFFAISRRKRQSRKA